MGSVTVPGPSGSPATIPGIGSNPGSSIIQLIADGLALASPSSVASYNGSGTVPSGGTSGDELVVTGSGGAATSVPGFGYVVNLASGVNSLAGTNVALISGTAGGAFWVDGKSTVAAAGGSNTVVGQAGGTYFLATGDGNDLLYNTGSGTMAGGGGSNLLWAAGTVAGATNVIVSDGTSDTIVAGAGSSTVAVYGGNALIFGGSGSMVIGAGNGSTISAGTGAETIFGGNADVVFGNHSSGIMFVGGSGSASIVGSDKSAVTVFGHAGSDVNFYSSSTPGAVLLAGSGNETLNAAGSANDVFWANNQSVGGAATLTGGSGSNTYNFVSVHAGGSYMITDFSSKDAVNLINYGASADSSALSHVATVGGSAVITLSDNTQITFHDVTSLNSANFRSV